MAAHTDKSTPSLRGGTTKQSVETKQSLRMERSEAKHSVEATRKRIPKLRFKEFDGEWEKKKLGDISTFSKGKSISKSDIDENGKLECIRYGELYTTYGEIITEIASKTNLNSENLILSEFNDVIIPASGETQIDIATASCIMKDGVALSGDLNIIRSEANGVFLSYYLNSKRKIDIARLSQGISVVHLYSSQLKTLNLNIPKNIEQQKIASFLSAVDEKIQQLTKKKALLEQYKKGVMQQLFSGKLRFKPTPSLRGETTKQTVESNYPDWEVKRLGDISTFLDGRRKPIKSSDRTKMQGKYPYYGASGIIDYVNNYIFDEEIILLGEDGENIISRNLPLAFRVSGKCWINNHAHVIKPDQNTNIDFITFSLERINFVPYNTGTAQPKLNQKVCQNIPLNIPCLEEQQKIANYLSALDTKIETVNQQITKTQAFKKGLLQQLFV
ncbi:restriction endonuclease subunit S [Cellulophaga baltica]|uniref:restriction endonuclease subunit S n=1 Tax=Cellulophaga baltica TaxID=76594 RepID=UPI0004110BE0|nr:restriction endonuclease subunit S [Cellulophaga baltica]